jgi:undecaprenyl diphosphate synthase
MVEASMELGITHLTLFSFSSENWSRPQQEIYDLFGLLRRFVRRDLAELHKNGVKIHVIGSRDGLEDDILRMLDDAVELTKDNTALNLIIAFNYGSRDEIARAARRIAEDAKEGKLAPEDVTQDRFAAYLDTAGLPDPDLLIRTSGELRLSNFLLWQISYSELYVSSVCWPEFRKAQLEEAFDAYASRQRKFGGLISDAAPEGTSGPSPRPAPAAPGTSTRRSPERPPSAGPPDRPATGSGRSAPAKRPR